MVWLRRTEPLDLFFRKFCRSGLTAKKSVKRYRVDIPCTADFLTRHFAAAYQLADIVGGIAVVPRNAPRRDKSLARYLELIHAASIYLAENFLYSLFERLWIGGAITCFHALSYKELEGGPLPCFIVGNDLRVRVNHFLRDLGERVVVDNLRQNSAHDRTLSLRRRQTERFNKYRHVREPMRIIFPCTSDIIENIVCGGFFKLRSFYLRCYLVKKASERHIPKQLLDILLL